MNKVLFGTNKKFRKGIYFHKKSPFTCEMNLYFLSVEIDGWMEWYEREYVFVCVLVGLCHRFFASTDNLVEWKCLRRNKFLTQIRYWLAVHGIFPSAPILIICLISLIYLLLHWHFLERKRWNPSTSIQIYRLEQLSFAPFCFGLHTLSLQTALIHMLYSNFSIAKRIFFSHFSHYQIHKFNIR